MTQNVHTGTRNISDLSLTFSRTNFENKKPLKKKGILKDTLLDILTKFS